MTDDNCTLLHGCINPFHDHTPETNAMPALSGMVDPTDPAFERIARVLLDMRAAEVELSAETVAVAIRLGRLYHSGTVKPPTPPTPLDTLRQHVVYYLRFGNLIKIGTTSSLYTRVRELRPDEILAAEPGYRALEAQRHQQFARHRVERELFAPAPTLLDHIHEVVAQHGHPAVVANR
jgi:hypothetical protein